MTARITATAAARSAISVLRAATGGPVMFVQSGGCCAGSTPMCYPEGEFVVGPSDLLLGQIDGCPCYIDRRLDEAWGHPAFILDTAPGDPEGFSLGAGSGQRFVTRAASHAHRCAPTGPAEQA